MRDNPVPIAWMIDYTEGGQPHRALHLHNAIDGYLLVDPKATSTVVYEDDEAAIIRMRCALASVAISLESVTQARDLLAGIERNVINQEKKK